ncbi:hypothetical protein V2J09_007383 [Rumex salicifolius]
MIQATLLSNDEEDIKRSDFPDDFLWGTSTSAYQIAGGCFQDRKSLNKWDVFLFTKLRKNFLGGISNGDTGDVADDHYHRFMI